MNNQLELGNTFSKEAGLQKTAQGMVFTVSNEMRRTGFLKIYTPKQIYKVPLEQGQYWHGLCSIEVLGMHMERGHYLYEIDGADYIDDYAHGIEAVSPDQIWGCWDFTSYPWQTKDFFHSYETAIVYKLHVRGYTKDKQSGVKRKGTFLGLTEKIPYLKDLGVQIVELMPIYEFQEQKRGTNNDLKNFWGYTKGLYLAPKRSYCATDEGSTEVKKMVSQFHQANIEVVLDFSFPIGKVYEKGINMSSILSGITKFIGLTKLLTHET